MVASSCATSVLCSESKVDMTSVSSVPFFSALEATCWALDAALSPNPGRIDSNGAIGEDMTCRCLRVTYFARANDNGIPTKTRTATTPAISPASTLVSDPSSLAPGEPGLLVFGETGLLVAVYELTNEAFGPYLRSSFEMP